MDKEKDSEEKEEEIEKPSYTYWKRESDMKADHKGFTPQQTNQKVDENPNKIGSAWNKAGTWEEKKITKKQLEDFFNNYIKNNKKNYKEAFYFDEFSSYSGDVIFFIYFFQTYFVFSRGKIKFIYDCEIQVKLCGLNEDEGKSTTVTLKEVNNEEEDEHFQFEYESGSSRKHLNNICKTVEKEIEKDIRKIFSELKESFLK